MDDDMIPIPRLDMTKAVQVSEEMQRLRAAYQRVADRPEFLPNERVYWLDLRQAVEKVLERYG